MFTYELWALDTSILFLSYTYLRITGMLQQFVICKIANSIENKMIFFAEYFCNERFRYN